MSEKKALNAEELLEKIFYYMNRLVEEKEFSSTIHILTDLGRTLVNSDRASFWLWDKRRKEHWTIVALDNGKITVPEGAGVVGTSIMNNETIVINNPYEDSRFNQDVDKETGYVTKSILCMPVTNTKGEVIGAYQAINKLKEDGEPGSFSDLDISRLTLAAIYCGKTLESYLLYNEAQIDSITGLKNQKGFYEYYNMRVMPFLISNKMTGVMGDIDHFRQINEEYGRGAGDALLKTIADTIQYSIYIDDEAIRWKDDKFIILLSNKTKSEAIGFTEKLRKKIETLACDYNGQTVKATMSFGVEEFSFHKSSDENIKLIADKVYDAKFTGRNKVL